MSLKNDWEDLAKMDSLWAILSDPSKKNSKWDIEEFFETGQGEVESIIKILGSVNPLFKKDKVLDFGCGVGRLARFFSKHFKAYIGVDISDEMIKKAKEFNKDGEFFTIDENVPFGRFTENYFDFIYSFIVLQHIPRKSVIKNTIKEFIRCLKMNGMAYFQLPSYIPLMNRIQPRKWAYKLLRSLGLSQKFLYNNLKLYPISMSYISVKDMEKLFNQNNVKILKIENPGQFATRYLIEKM